MKLEEAGLLTQACQLINRLEGADYFEDAASSIDGFFLLVYSRLPFNIDASRASSPKPTR